LRYGGHVTKFLRRRVKYVYMYLHSKIKLFFQECVILPCFVYAIDRVWQTETGLGDAPDRKQFSPKITSIYTLTRMYSWNTYPARLFIRARSIPPVFLVREYELHC